MVDVACTAPPLAFALRVDDDGVLQLCPAGGDDSAVRASGTAVQFLLALQGNTSGLRVDGNAELGRDFFAALRALNPNVFGVLARLIGDGPAGVLDALARDVRRDAEILGDMLGATVAHSGVGAQELAEWVRGVADLRLALERLDARVSRLET